MAVLSFVVLNFYVIPCHSQERIKVKDILRQLKAQNSLIRDYKAIETIDLFMNGEKMPTGGSLVCNYKSPDKYRYDIKETPNIVKKSVIIRVGELQYTYVYENKILEIIRYKKTPEFTFVDMLYILTQGSDTKLLKMKEKEGHTTYLLEALLEPTNRFYHLGSRKLKVWIDKKKWIITKAEMETAGGIKASYIVKYVKFLGKNIWFPTKVEEVIESPRPDGTKNVVKKVWTAKNIRINTNIPDSIFTLKVPEGTKVTFSYRYPR